jgi:hypothetical protein
MTTIPRRAPLAEASHVLAREVDSWFHGIPHGWQHLK